MSVMEFFPYSSPRPKQADVLSAVVSSLSKKRNVIVEAPPGTGKSAIAITLARYYGSAIITTPFNSLIDQYAKEFPQYPNIKGKAHYKCEDPDYYGNSVDKGYCTLRSMVCKCPYLQIKQNAHSFHIAITNLDWLVSQDNIIKRKLLIVDEAQHIDAIITRHHTISFNLSDFVSGPKKLDFESVFEWIVKEGEEEAKQNTEAYSHFKSAFTDEEMLRGYEIYIKWYNLYTKFEFIKSDFKKHNEKYIITNDDEKITLRPLTCKRFLESLFKCVDNVVLMSATPPSASAIGLKDTQYIKVSHTFPKQNRPIVMKFVGSMSLKNRSITIPKMADAITRLSVGKTIVHAHSYQIAKDISKHMKISHYLQDPRQRTDAMSKWSWAEEGILLSVAMSEGIDLPDDACRTNILAKIPFLNPTDPHIVAKTEAFGQEWANKQVVNTIIQAYGRGVRHDKDKANFIILDSDFEWFFARNRHLFPLWFSEAVGQEEVIF